MLGSLAESLKDSLPYTESLLVGVTEAIPPEYVGLYRDAAVLIVIVEGDAPALLLTQRAEHLLLHPNEIAFPGGKPHASDKDLIATAIREAQEEVNLLAEQFNYVGQLAKRITRSDFLLTPCVGTIPNMSGLRANPNEVAELFSVPLSLLVDGANWQFDWQSYRGAERFMPRFEFKQHIVEGVTALLVVDLMNSIFKAGLPSHD